MMAAVAPLAGSLRLEPAVVCAEATRRSGLTDFGPPEFREPLDVFCAAIGTAGLSPFGVVATFATGVRSLIGS